MRPGRWTNRSVQNNEAIGAELDHVHEDAEPGRGSGIPHTFTPGAQDMITVSGDKEDSSAAGQRLRSTGGDPIGTARRIDALGRVVVPAELRRLLGIKEGDLLDIHVEDGQLVLQRIDPACAVCAGREGLRPLHGKHVCASCVESISSAP